MTLEQFHSMLRGHIRRQPFVPYTIVLKNGERLEVDAPNAVAFNGRSAGFIDAQGEVHFFHCGDVQEIVAASPEPSA